jgi:hypothetical protein
VLKSSVEEKNKMPVHNVASPQLAGWLLTLCIISVDSLEIGHQEFQNMNAAVIVLDVVETHKCHLSACHY